jgi:hypothetical protein
MGNGLGLRLRGPFGQKAKVMVNDNLEPLPFDETGILTLTQGFYFLLLALCPMLYAIF